jgi:uncharacterized protein DUF4175
MQDYNEIRELIDRVRTRWRTLRAFDAILRAAVTAAVVIGAALFVTRWAEGRPGLLVAVAAAALVLAVIGVVRALWPLRQVPGDRQVARYIEERTPALDDRLVTAVDVAARQNSAPTPIAEPMLADAAKRARAIELDTIVPNQSLRRAGLKAAAAAVVFLVVLFAGRETARQTIDAASLTMWPERVAIEVTPGNARIKAGSPVPIHARLVGNRAPVLAQLQIADGDGWRTSEMKADGASNAFALTLESLATALKYRVVAGAAASPSYEISVVHPPRVSRIDVDYTYPAGLNLPQRSESDSGDIYAPAGTDVRIHVFTDRPAATGQMALAAGRAVALTPVKDNELVAALKITVDDSYRVGLADASGMAAAGDTEYFIRTLEDRPPEVHITKPAADRPVTRLEEVDIEVQAEDDYGVDRLELVYSVRGGNEKSVPLSIARGRTAVDGRHTLFLEDLDVQPGDFVSYYARARDLTRGTRPNEARSDIFFLEVKPYEQEFALAQSQGGMAGAGRNSLDDLVAAQKEVVVATWKLDRRAQSSKGAKSEQDVRSVARAEAELKTRVEETSSTFRESTMRDPRRRQPRPGGRGGNQPPQPAQPELKAGQTLPEEDDMTAAAESMGKAVTSLDALKTADALPPEMDALNRLLKAQAAVKRREITQQQASSGSGSNRSNVDISTLFDRELQKAQQTNYETKTSAEQKDNPNQSALDKIKDLAHRQDELLKKQQELARNRDSMSEEELKRELEKLTREQSELRQRAEELARQTAAQNASNQASQQKEKAGQQGQSGQQSQSGRSGQQGQSGQRGQSGEQSGSQGNGAASDDASKRMRDASEEMRNATSDLRRQDAQQAAAAGNRALDRLREAARQLESANRSDDRRRAVGDLQLEARQVAEGERQVASELAKSAGGEAGKDTLRKLAGEQERLAGRARKLTDSLKQAAAARGGPDARASASGPEGEKTDARAQAAASEAARELDRQKLADRMQQSADALRQATDARGQRGTTAPPDPAQQARGQVGAQQDLARAMDKIADTLANGASTQDAESRKLSEQLSRAQSLREKLDATARQMETLKGQRGQNGGGRQGQNAQKGGGTDAGSTGRSAGASGKAGEGTQGGGGSSADVAKLREEYARRLQETKDLVDQMRREDPTFARGGSGFTFEQPTTQTVTAPGTEAFKQDFAKWDDLRRQATQALENVEATLSKKLQAKQSKDRLAAGSDDKAPPQYKQQVDSYFKAIASRRKQ